MPPKSGVRQRDVVVRVELQLTAFMLFVHVRGLRPNIFPATIIGNLRVFPTKLVITFFFLQKGQYR